MHEGLLLFDVTTKVLAAVFVRTWEEKLLSAAKDGARNMTGVCKGQRNSFEGMQLPGFSRSLCAVHQLYFTVQDTTNNVLQNIFEVLFSH